MAVLSRAGGPALNVTESEATARAGHQRLSGNYDEESSARVIQCTELSGVSFLRHGTGTSLFTATLQRDSQLERVVVKAPRYGIGPDGTAEITEELEQEVSMLLRVRHPHVVRLFGTGTLPLRDGSSVFFLAVGYLEGGTLQDRLRTKPPAPSEDQHRLARDAMATLTLSPAASASGGGGALGGGRKNMTYLDVLAAAEGLAEALEHVHDAADPAEVVIHRDLKPDNVGFNANGDVILLDFGLATSVPRRPSDSCSGTSPRAAALLAMAAAQPQRGGAPASAPLPPPGGGGESSGGVPMPRYRLTGHTGSVRYMAPEVALDQPYNQAVDVYSFAMVLWEMVYRKKPFSGMGVEAHRNQVCLQGVRPPLDRRVAPPDLVRLLQSCWDDNPDRRPPFAEVRRRLTAMRAAAASDEKLRRSRGSTWGLRSSFLSFNKKSSSSWF